MTTQPDLFYNRTMPTPILATKLYMPASRPNGISRPRLIEQLNEGLQQTGGFGRKLTLISAPAGFGKTTLVSQWLNSLKTDSGRKQTPNQIAWLSLDERDNDLTLFLTYIVAALQTIQPTFGTETLNLLQSPPPLPTQPLLTTLINEMAAMDTPSILVLDDYHVISDKPVDETLSYLIERLPPQIHLIIITREDPNLPIARLRVRDQVTELRVPDLRFTSNEAAQFLNQSMTLSLSKNDIGRLEIHTEGWIAGLQLAALSMQKHQNKSEFIESFSGSNRFIVDYLVEEILQQQPDHIQKFLLQTSILDRLCGPLCEAVYETIDGENRSGQAILAHLERTNLLIVPLDETRHWYRYHPLLADALKARLTQESSSSNRDLHRQASVWYEQNNLPFEAIDHALAAEAFERAATLIELAWSDIRRSCFRSPTWLGWVKVLPDDLIQVRPVLAVGYAWELINFGQIVAAETPMQAAERWLEQPTNLDDSSGNPTDQMVVVNDVEYASLRPFLAIARSYLTQASGDVPNTIIYAEKALKLASEEDYYIRGMAGTFLGMAYWTTGALDAAYKAASAGREQLQQAGNILFALNTTFVLADIKIAQGRLHEAKNIYKRALQLAETQGDAILQGVADLYLGLSELAHLQGDRGTAKQHLQQSLTLGEQVALPHWPYRLAVAEAQIKWSEGDIDETLKLLDKAEQLYFSIPAPNIRPVGALRARLWVAEDKLNEAVVWARENSLSSEDDLTYVREFEHLTFARILIAQHRNAPTENSIHQAETLLDRLLTAAEDADRTGSVIEILMLQALAHDAQGNRPAALESLEQALILAEPEGYIQRFVDEGQPMADLLSKAAAAEIMPAYINKLRATFEKSVPIIDSSSLSSNAQPLIEPLTPREQEVLRLIAAGRTNPEIATELIIAVTTVKTHVKNIYGKLQVTKRFEAIAQAKALNLL
ncbi:MAG: LuxR C-terminal-related transcriptional regulator [Chloroflexota bacterium]